MKHAFLHTFTAVVLIAFCAAAQASPFTIDFRFADPNSTAQAVGSVTLESTLLQNPGQNDFQLPNPAVLALNVTVTGSATGNGSFTLSDFDGFTLETNGGTLDFSRQLVGQPTSGKPWGTTPSSGEAGDFNLFSGSSGRPAHAYAARGPVPAGGPTGLPPNGDFYFTLGANGDTGELMVLVSAVPSGFVAATVPALSPWSLGLLVSLFGFGALIAMRRVAAKR